MERVDRGQSTLFPALLVFENRNTNLMALAEVIINTPSGNVVPLRT